MTKDKLKTIAKSRFFIGFIFFILGGLFFGGTSGIDITEERYNQLLDMEQIALGNTNSNENNDSSEDSTEEDDSTKENQKFGVGETVYLIDSNDVKLMSLTINSAKLISDRNEYSDTQAEKVVEIDYTYENLGYDENLDLYDSNFKVYDKSGNILESYPAGADKHPQSISVGKKCTANMSFALNDDSNELELEFYENIFGDSANAVFTITATE